MKATIRSSSKTKPDPAYYRNKVHAWTDQRDALLLEAARQEEANGNREATGVRIAADRLDAKIHWAMLHLLVACRMKQQAA